MSSPLEATDPVLTGAAPRPEPTRVPAPVPRHLRLCAWLHVASGLAILLLLSLGLAYVAARLGTSGLPAHLRGLLGSAGLAVGTALCIVAGLELIGGVALLHQRAAGRPLLLLCSVFQLANVPLGTALGLYSFWALVHAGPSPGADRPPA